MSCERKQTKQRTYLAVVVDLRQDAEEDARGEGVDQEALHTHTHISANGCGEDAPYQKGQACVTTKYNGSYP